MYVCDFTPPHSRCQSLPGCSDKYFSAYFSARISATSVVVRCFDTAILSPFAFTMYVRHFLFLSGLTRSRFHFKSLSALIPLSPSSARRSGGKRSFRKIRVPFLDTYLPLVASGMDNGNGRISFDGHAFGKLRSLGVVVGCDFQNRVCFAVWTSAGYVCGPPASLGFTRACHLRGHALT